MNKPTAQQARPEQIFFEDPAVDRLLGVVMALATSHFVLRERVQALEAQLARAGHIDPAALAQAPEDGGDSDAAEFADSLLRPLLGIQEAAGAPGFFTLKNDQ